VKIITRMEGDYKTCGKLTNAVHINT